MLKKSLVLLGILLFASSSISFASENAVVKNSNCPCPCAKKQIQCPRNCKGQNYAKRRAEFEKRLNLTAEQKTKIAEIRKNAYEQMLPIINEIKDKRQEMEAVKLSRMAVRMQEEKLAELTKDIEELKVKAHEIRMQNMKQFEEILTKSQLKELKKMKAEGRKKYKQLHGSNMHKYMIPNCKRYEQMTQKEIK